MRQEGQPEQTLTDEAALARALHLSLVEVQHQERGHVAGSGAQPAAAASTALQDTIPEHMQGMAPEYALPPPLAAYLLDVYSRFWGLARTSELKSAASHWHVILGRLWA